MDDELELVVSGADSASPELCVQRRRRWKPSAADALLACLACTCLYALLPSHSLLVGLAGALACLIWRLTQRTFSQSAVYVRGLGLSMEARTALGVCHARRFIASDAIERFLINEAIVGHQFCVVLLLVPAHAQAEPVAVFGDLLPRLALAIEALRVLARAHAQGEGRLFGGVAST